MSKQNLENLTCRKSTSCCNSFIILLHLKRKSLNSKGGSRPNEQELWKDSNNFIRRIYDHLRLQAHAQTFVIKDENSSICVLLILLRKISQQICLLWGQRTPSTEDIKVNWYAAAREFSFEIKLSLVPRQEEAAHANFSTKDKGPLRETAYSFSSCSEIKCQIAAFKF